MKSSLVLIQGNLKQTQEAQQNYQNYLKGTVPLMQKYRVSIFAVGGGIQSNICTDVFSVNAILHFPSFEAVHAFFEDEDYQQIKVQYRDAAYDSLELSIFQLDATCSPPPLGTGTLLLSSTMDHASAISPYFEATRVHTPSIQPQANSDFLRCLFWMNQEETSPHPSYEVQSHHIFQSETFSLSDLSSFRLTHWINRPPQVPNPS